VIRPRRQLPASHTSAQAPTNSPKPSALEPDGSRSSADRDDELASPRCGRCSPRYCCADFWLVPDETSDTRYRPVAIALRTGQ
jgi:hypothetical protein